MTERKMLTREEFEAKRREWALELAGDAELQDEALDLLVKADRHNWLHQTTWFGEPILQLPQDLFTLQEIIFNTRPKYIIEVGVAWAGSLLFYSTLMNVLGGDRIIGIDVYIPPDLRARIAATSAVSERITLIEGSSLDPEVIAQVRAITGESRETLVHLDSSHTHAHVLAELKTFAPFVGKSHYLICGDTVVERIPPQSHRPRPWGPGNNPKTALDEYLHGNDDWEVDPQFDRKSLLSSNPGGYLRRVRD